MKNSFTRSLFFRLVAMLLVLSAPVFSSCEKDDNTQEEAAQREQEYKVIDDGIIRAYLTRHGITEGSGLNQYRRLSDAANDGIYLVNLTEGTGTTNIVNNNRVEVKYVGRFIRETNETTVFDNSTEKGIPCGCFPVTVGAGSVIKGWDQGLLQMKKGDRKLLLIPSYLAYGPAGRRDASGALIFPVDEPLLFDMTVLDVR